MKKRPDGRYKVSLTIDGKRHYFYGRTIKLCPVAGSKRGGKRTRYYGVNKKGQPSFNVMVVPLVRVEGLEPSRREAPDPKSGASAIPPHSQVPFYFTMLSSYWSNKKYGIIFLYIS